jgi:hypothetical protein
MNATEAVRRLREVIRRQHKALATEASYVHWLRHYMAALADMPPNLTSEQKLERFLTALALRRDVAASTQNQAFNAIAFFYKDVLGTPLQNVDALRATRPALLRHAPTIAETRALLQAIRDVAGYPTNLIARLLYGCGLRLTEPLNLRIKDVDLERAVLCIRGAKGGKDRVVALPACLKAEIARQREVAAALWRQDARNRVPLEIPHQLACKYPNISSRGLGPGCSRRANPVATPARVRSCVTGCTRRTSSVRSKKRVGSSGSWSCRTSCVTPTPRTAWSGGPIRVRSKKRWGTRAWKPRWVTCTPRV